MAITILLQPQEFQPVYNEIMTVLESTNSSEPNFQYVIDVNINGVKKSRLKVSPNPDGYGEVDLHKHIEPFVTSDIDYDDTDTFQLTPNSFTKYDITLLEEYRVELTFTLVTDSGGNTNYSVPTPHYLQVGDKVSITDSIETSYNGVQTVTAVLSTTTFVTTKTFTVNSAGNMVKADFSNTLIPDVAVFTGNKYANSSVLNFLDVSSFDYQDWLLNTGISPALLLTTNQINYVKPSTKCWLNFYNSVTDNAYFLQVTTNNGVFTIENDNYKTSNDTNKFLTFSCGTEQLENSTNTIAVISGALPMFDTDTVSYSVKLTTAIATSSKTYTFNIDNSCSAYENFELIYQDQFGSFIPVNFDRASKQTISNKKSDFRQNYGSYDSVANTYGWEAKDRGTKRLDTDITEIINIQTNWVTEVQGTKVIELMNSPEVYLNDGTKLISINIQTSRLVQKKRITDGLINYQLSFEYSFKNTVQRG